MYPQPSTASCTITSVVGQQKALWLWTSIPQVPILQHHGILLSEFTLHRSPRDYEEDHLIPLEIGGDPRDPRNLWPQPINEAHVKDRLENVLHMKVCAKQLPLPETQKCISVDWAQCWVKMGRP